MLEKKYKLECEGCGALRDDDGLTLHCEGQHEPALLVTKYARTEFRPSEASEGIYRYKEWLPVLRELEGSGRTITYQSERLSQILGLPNLWIAFNGYWPEKGANLGTTSFKDLEAYTVLARIPADNRPILVVSSAGNTAAAFARACSINRIRCLIIVPESGLQAMQFAVPLSQCVRIVSLVGFSDYYDAVMLGERVSRLDSFFAEGGVRNVGRRDGLGTALLSAVEVVGRLPDYYFQAVGSGSGGIAAFNTAQKLIGDGRFGSKMPKLMLSQNLPFVPLFLSWKSKGRQLVEINPVVGKSQIRQIAAHVLSNRNPPYSIKGGVFDVLNESNGEMLVADNSETLCASRLFEGVEGIDIDPAGAVAFATLIKAAKDDLIDHNGFVLLNITGGGCQRQGMDHRLVSARPDLQIPQEETADNRTFDRIEKLFM